MITGEEVREAERAFRRIQKTFLNYELESLRRGDCPERSTIVGDGGCGAEYGTQEQYEDWIKEHYPQTKDAKVIEKYLGQPLRNRFLRFLWAGQEAQFLIFAQQLEKERLERKKEGK